MDTIIETSKLGPVTVSSRVIEHFRKQSEHRDPAKSTEEVVQALQSQQIEKLEVPAVIAQRMLMQRDHHTEVEFWAHPDNSMVFTVIPQDNCRLVSMAIKQSMAGFVLGNS